MRKIRVMFHGPWRGWTPLHEQIFYISDQKLKWFQGVEEDVQTMNMSIA